MYHTLRIPQCHKSLFTSYNEMSAIHSCVLIARGIFLIDTHKIQAWIKDLFALAAVGDDV